MIRKHITLSVALLMALTGTASAARGQSAPPAVDTAIDTSIIRDAPECGGKGFTKLLTNTKEGFSCVHTAGDVFNPYAQASAMAAKGRKPPATAKVECFGDGTTGPRIQMVYAFPDNLPNRSATVVKQIRNEMAPRMQAVLNNQGAGRNVGLRFAWTKGCAAIDVLVMRFPRSVQDATDPRDPNGQIKRAVDYMVLKGYTRDDRKYLIMWDGWNVGACGIGELAAGSAVTSAPVAPISDGLHTIGARTAPPKLGSTKYSMVFNHAGGKNGPTCFNTQGLSTVTPQLHELFHTLGAVQYDAPHANTGHCDDAPSVMCPGGGPGYGLGVNNPSCAKVLIETLDCGMDDYWNPNPPAGNYLFTHLNIAKSKFIGPQPQDNLVASPL